MEIGNLNQEGETRTIDHFYIVDLSKKVVTHGPLSESAANDMMKVKFKNNFNFIKIKSFCEYRPGYFLKHLWV